MTDSMFLVGHSRLPEHSDVIICNAIRCVNFTSETALVHKCLSTSRVVHLTLALACNHLVNQDANEANKHKAANDDSDDSASVFFRSFIRVLLEN